MCSQMLLMNNLIAEEEWFMEKFIIDQDVENSDYQFSVINRNSILIPFSSRLKNYPGRLEWEECKGWKMKCIIVKFWAFNIIWLLYTIIHRILGCKYKTYTR